MRDWLGTRGWRLGARDSPCRAAAFEIRSLDGVGQPLAYVVAFDLHTVDHDLQRRAIAQAPRIHIVKAGGGAVDEEAGKTLASQPVDGGGKSGGARGRGVFRSGGFLGRLAVFSLLV